MLTDPDPDERALVPKLSAVCWTLRDSPSPPDYTALHIMTIKVRTSWLHEGQPAAGDTKELLIRLLKRATTELPWPELPGGTKKMFDDQIFALKFIAKWGEPEAAVEILGRHVEDVERHVVAPNRLATY
jgi:hypothetical protein